MLSIIMMLCIFSAPCLAMEPEKMLLLSNRYGKIYALSNEAGQFELALPSTSVTFGNHLTSMNSIHYIDSSSLRGFSLTMMNTPEIPFAWICAIGETHDRATAALFWKLYSTNFKAIAYLGEVPCNASSIWPTIADGVYAVYAESRGNKTRLAGLINYGNRTTYQPISQDADTSAIEKLFVCKK